jgi:hypothetical protein
VDPIASSGQCVADTTATYRLREKGAVQVFNRCRTADGTWDQVTGIARPPSGVARIEAGRLHPAQLEVSALVVAVDRHRLGRLLDRGSGTRRPLCHRQRSVARVFMGVGAAAGADFD